MLRFTVDGDRFARAAKLALECADQKNTNPLLASTVIVAQGTTIVVSATNLRESITCELDAEIESPGSVALPAKQLEGIARISTGGPMTLIEGKGRWCTFETRSTTYRLAGTDAEMAPEIPDCEGVRWIEVGAGAFAALLDRVSFACSCDATRQELCGVQIVSDKGSATACAIDGHRMSVVKVSIGGLEASLSEAIVPQKAANVITKMLSGAESCDIAIRETERSRIVHVRLQDVVFSTVCIDGQFPPYKNVIDERSGYVEVSRDALAGAIKRITTVIHDAVVKLTLTPDGIDIESDDLERSSGRERVDAAICGEVKDGVYASARSRYILEHLDRAVPEQTIRISIVDELRPILVHPDPDDGSSVGVIMPMR